MGERKRQEYFSVVREQSCNSVCVCAAECDALIILAPYTQNSQNILLLPLNSVQRKRGGKQTTRSDSWSKENEEINKGKGERETIQRGGERIFFKQTIDIEWSWRERIYILKRHQTSGICEINEMLDREQVRKRLKECLERDWNKEKVRWNHK